MDEAYRDREGLLSPDTDQMWTTGELTYDQFGTLIQDKGYPKLADYLQAAQPGKKFIVVGQKGYAVESAAAESAFDSSDADIAVRFSGRSASSPVAGTPDAACNATLGGRYRGPDGVNVPTYIKDPFCGRFYVNSSTPTAPVRRSPRGSIRSTGTGSSRGPIRPTSAVTRGWPTRPSR